MCVKRQTSNVKPHFNLRRAYSQLSSTCTSLPPRVLGVQYLYQVVGISQDACRSAVLVVILTMSRSQRNLTTAAFDLCDMRQDLVHPLLSLDRF
jgi:hypothetical protein